MIRLRTRLVLLLLICAQQPLRAQSFNSWQTDLTRQQSYTLKRASSADTTGGNADFRPMEPGKTLTLLDADVSGALTHIWITLYLRKALCIFTPNTARRSRMRVGRTTGSPTAIRPLKKRRT